MKRVFVMSLLSAVLGLFSCNAQTVKFKSVDASAFAQVIADSTVLRLDVRTVAEYEQGHIQDAVNIDVLEPDFQTNAMMMLPKNRTIALYCRSGNRSKTAARILSEIGYDVIELASGYIGWKNSNR